MAINVVYQIPSALYREQRRQEQRQDKQLADRYAFEAYKLQEARNAAQDARQQNLAGQMAMSKMAYQNQARRDAIASANAQKQMAYDYSLKNRQLAYDYASKQADRNSKAQLQRDEQNANMLMQVQKASDENYATALKSIYSLENEYDYSPQEQTDIANIVADMGQVQKDVMNGKLTRAEGLDAIEQLRQKRIMIRPTTPKRPQKTAQEEFDSNVVTITVNGITVKGTIDKNGVFHSINASMESEKQRSVIISECNKLRIDLYKNQPVSKMTNEQIEAIVAQTEQSMKSQTEWGREEIRQKQAAEQAIAEQQRQIALQEAMLRNAENIERRRTENIQNQNAIISETNNNFNEIANQLNGFLNDNDDASTLQKKIKQLDDMQQQVNKWSNYNVNDSAGKTYIDNQAMALTMDIINTKKEVQSQINCQKPYRQLAELKSEINACLNDNDSNKTWMQKAHSLQLSFESLFTEGKISQLGYENLIGRYNEIMQYKEQLENKKESKNEELEIDKAFGMEDDTTMRKTNAGTTVRKSTSANKTMENMARNIVPR